MQPHFHAAVAIVVGAILGLQPETHVFFVVFSVLIDIDFIFSILVQKNNHRDFATHSPVLWLCTFVLFMPFSQGYLIGLAGILHVAFDALDWGIPWLWPLKKKHSKSLLSGFPTSGGVGVGSTRWNASPALEDSRLVALEVIAGIFAFFFSFSSTTWLFVLYLILLCVFAVLFREPLSKKVRNVLLGSQVSTNT